MYKQKGFTLIELLIVIAIIAIIAAVAFVALDPLTRFRDSRDAKRWADISAIISAIKVDQVDNGGSYLASINGLTPGDTYMIVDGNITTGCNGYTTCDVTVTDASSCVNLQGLANEGYLGDVPVSPNGANTWSSSLTGYTLTASTSGAIIIQACESENTSAIYVAR